MRTLIALAVLLAFSACVPLDNVPMWLPSEDRAVVYEAVAIHQRAVALFELGKVRDAITVAAKAVELLESKLGRNHSLLAVPLRSLAIFHQADGAYTQAEVRFARVLGILEKADGHDALALIMPLEDLAALYMQWGAFDKAEVLYRRVLSLRSDELYPRDPRVVDSLNDIALALEMRGEHARAEPLYKRALALAERVSGSGRVDMARSLEGLARLYATQGMYDQAEPLLVRALAIRSDRVAGVRRLGPVNVIETIDLMSDLMSDPARALRIPRSLGSFDQLYSEDLPRVQPLIARTADIYSAVLSAAQADAAQTLEQTVALHVATGNLKRAESLLVRALQVRENLVGAQHPGVANSLNDLAQLYQTQGAHAKAEPLLRRVLEIRRQALGDRHPDVARALCNLALLYMAQGAYDKAEPLLAQGVDVFEHASASTPDLARGLNNLALLHHLQGDLATAEPQYRRAIEVASKLPGGGYPDAVRYMTNLAVLYHATGVSEKAEPLLRRAAELRESRLDTELARLSAARKRALMALVQQETEALVSLHVERSPTSAPALELALTTVLRRKGLALESLLANQAALRAHLTPEIQDQLDQLSVEHAALTALQRARAGPSALVARTSRIAATTKRIEQLESELSEISAKLYEHTKPVTAGRIQAVLPPGAALIEFVRYHRFDPRPGQPRWHEARYAAYIVLPRSRPRCIALGEAAAIDAAIAAMHAEMRRGGDPEAANAALRRLDALVLEPLRGPLGNVSHLILAPDGALNLVPFEALRDPQGRYELEHRLVSYVTSGRDLLSRGPRQAPRQLPTVVAAPDYGTGRFAPLANSRPEAAEVAAWFTRARQLLGAQATKAALTALHGPAVLHVATHGFLTRDLAAPAAPIASMGYAEERGMDVDGLLAPVQLAAALDPAGALDRAGLALARANVSPDGIVTAREIAHYDWWGTELVVLSACDTGVGAAPSGDGVYGLRRALALAGAESQVVSLWSVGDTSVRALMRVFYGELARGTGRAEALRRAKRWMLQQPAFAHPYYWAALIPAGDWTPLDRNARLRPQSSP